MLASFQTPSLLFICLLLSLLLCILLPTSACPSPDSGRLFSYRSQASQRTPIDSGLQCQFLQSYCPADWQSFQSSDECRSIAQTAYFGEVGWVAGVTKTGDVACCSGKGLGLTGGDCLCKGDDCGYAISGGVDEFGRNIVESCNIPPVMKGVQALWVAGGVVGLVLILLALIVCCRACGLCMCKRQVVRQPMQILAIGGVQYVQMPAEGIQA